MATTMDPRVNRRRRLDPAYYGLDLEADAVDAELAQLLSVLYPAFAVDDLLLRPREALRYCDASRRLFGCYDLPDDVILRTLRVYMEPA